MTVVNRIDIVTAIRRSCNARTVDETSTLNASRIAWASYLPLCLSFAHAPALISLFTHSRRCLCSRDPRQIDDPRLSSRNATCRIPWASLHYATISVSCSTIARLCVCNVKRDSRFFSRPRRNPRVWAFPSLILSHMTYVYNRFASIGAMYSK